MTIKVLETLKDDNKTVAIISHIQKLKEYSLGGLKVQKSEVGSKITFQSNL